MLTRGVDQVPGQLGWTVAPKPSGRAVPQCTGERWVATAPGGERALVVAITSLWEKPPGLRRGLILARTGSAWGGGASRQHSSTPTWGRRRSRRDEAGGSHKPAATPCSSGMPALPRPPGKGCRPVWTSDLPGTGLFLTGTEHPARPGDPEPPGCWGWEALPVPAAPRQPRFPLPQHQLVLVSAGWGHGDAIAR